MTQADLVARVRRLDELMRGLAKELVLWKEGNDPLLYLERQAYLKAIQDALTGIETARIVLAKARQRTTQDKANGGTGSEARSR
jgi:hypothetical protein